MTSLFLLGFFLAGIAVITVRYQRDSEVSYAELEQPYLIDRDRWLVEICHTEYTLSEIQRGLWLKRISPALLTAPV